VIPPLTQPTSDGIEVDVKVARGEGVNDGFILVDVNVSVGVAVVVHAANRTTLINKKIIFFTFPPLQESFINQSINQSITDKY
jgi:hypothetical protein